MLHLDTWSFADSKLPLEHVSVNDLVLCPYEGIEARCFETSWFFSNVTQHARHSAQLVLFCLPCRVCEESDPRPRYRLNRLRASSRPHRTAALRTATPALTRSEQAVKLWTVCGVAILQPAHEPLNYLVTACFFLDDGSMLLA